MPSIAGYSHLSFTVTNLDKSTQWYREVLGFQLDSRAEGDGFRRNRLRHPDGGVILTLTEHQAGSGDRFDERRTGLDHVAFTVPNADGLHDFAERFKQLGIEHSDVKPTVSGAGGIITLRDPDNIQLEVFAAG